MERLKFLSKIALSFQNLTNFENEVQTVFHDIGNSLGLSRIVMFFEKAHEEKNDVFEWCNDCIDPKRHSFEHIPRHELSFLYSILKKEGSLCSNNVNELSSELITKLHLQNVKSLVIYPLVALNEIKGVITFNECKNSHEWKQEEIEILSTIAVLLSNAYERKLFQEDLISSKANFNNFFETSTDMFIVSDLEGRIQHCNTALVTNLNYSMSELKKMSIIDLHPVDQREAASAIVGKMLAGETEYCPLEVEGKFGNVFSVETRIWFGKWDKQDCLYSISKDVTNENETLQLVSNIFENNPVPMFIVNKEDYKFTKVNPAFIEKTGYSSEEILGKTFNELNLIHDVDELQKLKNKHKNNEKIKNAHLLLRRKDGSMLNGLFSVEELHSQGKKSLLTVMLDITSEQEQAQELERFFSINLDLLCIADMDGYFIKTNKAWEDILGYSCAELNGRKFLDFVHPDDLEGTLQAMTQLETGKKVIEFVNRYMSIDGTYHYIEWRSNPHENRIYAAARDITERIQYEKTILDVSNKDSLTNIYNRRYIYNRTEESLEKFKRDGTIFSVCILDIDHFKMINDTYGHHIGDFVLKEFTTVISDALRPDDLLGRYGGEEFIVILNNTDKKDSSLVVERILTIVRNKTFVFEEHAIQFTFSAGVASCLEIEKDTIVIDKLIEIADQKMYQAKKAGRNQIVF